MDRLKQTLLDTKEKKLDLAQDKIEVIGLTLMSCLKRVAKFWDTDIMSLDYEILEEGKRRLFKSEPYRLRVKLLSSTDSLAELRVFSQKIGMGERLLDSDLDEYIIPKNKDGYVVIRRYFGGSYLFVFPPIGNGKALPQEGVVRKLRHQKIEHFDEALLNEIVNEATGTGVKISDERPVEGNESNCKIEITADRMKVYGYISPPRQGGRHLQVQDIVGMLAANKVDTGINEARIEKQLLEENIKNKLLLAEGTKAINDMDAKIEYKVNLKKGVMHLQKDSHGNIDFKNLSTIENVVVGQILAEKIPLKKGKIGYTVFNEMVPPRKGKDIKLRASKGTSLIEDDTKIIATINGQVVYRGGKLSVEPVRRIPGDVGPKTGNINFIGSVYVGGSLLSGFEIRASGHIEIQGSAQNCLIEAGGDIVVRTGVNGAKIETTGGEVVAKFIQGSKVYSYGNVLATDSILRSEVRAENSIICSGRRAQIVGGYLWAGNELRARMVGSPAATNTEISVGISPTILGAYKETVASIEKVKLDIETNKKAIEAIESRSGSRLKQEQKDSLQDHKAKLIDLKKQEDELEDKFKELDEYFQEDNAGKVHAERTLHTGVEVNIGKAQHLVQENKNAVTLSHEKGRIKTSKVERIKHDLKRYRKWEAN